jgi:hypothetical protein
MKSSIRKDVGNRAEQRCEYCQIPESADELPFHLDHIIPKKHHGSDDLDNLAWACFACSTFKGYNISGWDQQTSDLTRLFNPRTDQWSRHFRWNGAELVALTPIGRVTLDILAINRLYRVRLRQTLIEEGCFPPERSPSVL